MALPEFTIRQLLEAGVHFGHRKHLWNPKMERYIYGTRNNLHIIDLGQTAPLLFQALQSISDTIANGGRVLMVGTKQQAQESIAAAAKQSAQYFVNARWLGGMLTNWNTVSQAIQRLRDMDEILGGDITGRTKKEILNLTRERDKLERNLGGIKDMGGVPDMLFVIDTNRESIAIKEAMRLNIPVAAVLDSNSNPEGITYPIPGNDDAARSISLYCDLVSQAAIDGLSRAQTLPEDAGVAAESSPEGPATGKAKSKESDSSVPKKTRKKSAKSPKTDKDSDGEKAKAKDKQDKKVGDVGEKSENSTAKKKTASKKKDSGEVDSDKKSKADVETDGKKIAEKDETKSATSKDKSADSAKTKSESSAKDSKNESSTAESSDKSAAAEAGKSEPDTTEISSESETNSEKKDSVEE